MVHVEAEAAGGQSPNDFSARQDRFVAHRIHVAFAECENRKAAARRLAENALRGVTPDEVTLVEPDEAGEPGLSRRIVHAVLAAPGPIALLEAQRAQRAHPAQPQ